MFAENLIGLGFLCFLHETNPNPRKAICCGKKWEKVAQNATFDLIFLGLGWPWVGGFDGFIIIFTCFSTRRNLVYREHPIPPGERVVRLGLGRRLVTILPAAERTM